MKVKLIHYFLFSLASILLLLGVTACVKFPYEFDMLISNGKIIDGTGNPWFKADVGIKNGKIIAIGTLKNEKSKGVIDATDLFVVPGFIDVHTHVDRKIKEYPHIPNYLLQGVTTVVGGNCGGSQLPLKELFTRLEQEGIAINFASLIGHNTIRREVMGNDDRAPTAEELSRMQELVKQEMLAGAIGFSTGLSYVPGRFSTTEEIIELVKVIEPYQGLYATHMRNQGKYIKEAIEEAIRIGLEAKVPVEISHIKLADEEVWNQYELITEPIEQVRRQGIQVFMDQYPYTATSSGFASSFPAWSVAGGHEAFVERLKDSEKYQKIKKALIDKRLISKRGLNRLESIYVAYDRNHHEYEGKNIAEILKLLGQEKTISNAADLIIKIEKEDRPRGIFFQMAEEDVATLMQLPYNMIASDGKVEIPNVEIPHPRAYGTFPRVLSKYVKEKRILSLPDAIRKMSSLPAQAMGFYNRGILRPGMWADIVIFNFDKIQDTAIYENPHQYPEGIEWVIVNGKVAAEKGEIVEKKSGMILFGRGRKIDQQQ